MYKGVSPYELSFLRSAFNLISSSILVWYMQQPLNIQCSGYLKKILVVRCLAGTVSFFFFTFAIKFLPLSIFFIVVNSIPFVSGVLAYLWLNEKLFPFEIVMMIVAFAGILMVAFSE